MKTYVFRIYFGDSHSSAGTIDIEANNENEANDKIAEYVSKRLYQALPELNIEFGWELDEVLDE